MESNTDNSAEREKGLLKALDRLIIIIAVSILAILVVLYFFLPNIISTSDQLLSFSQNLLINLVPIPLLFVISYATYRRIQIIRDAHDREIFINSLSDHLSEKLSVRETRQILLDAPPFEQVERIQAAQSLLVIGVSLNTKIHTQFAIFRNKLRGGSKIKILLVKPDSRSVPLVAQRKVNNSDPDAMNHYIRLTLSTLKKLKQEFPSQVQVHVIDYPLSFGVVATDIETDNGKIFLEYYSFKTEQDGLHLAIGTRDKPWYVRFKEQIQELWAFSEEWEYEANQKVQSEKIEDA